MQPASLPTSESTNPAASNKAKTTKTKASSPTMNLNMKGGELRCTVLSVYDLPTRDQPSYVSVSACGANVTTAAPTSRHKDRNSFKFSGPTSDLILKSKALSQLYASKFKVEVVYESKPWLNMTATYGMQELKVMESTWLVLNLDSAGGAGSTAITATTSVTTAGNDSTTMEDVPPTIRIKVQLRGPYRPEIATLLGLSSAWFNFMDNVESSTLKIVDAAPKLPENKSLLLIPAVPIATATVVLTPIVAGLCVIFLPVFVPVLAAILTVSACVAGTGLVLYSSTSSGRQRIGNLIEPAAQAMLKTQSGQSLIYETGPRPTPVSVARVVLPQGMWGRLIVSLAIDAIGSASYLVPVVGEVTDIGWAPIQTIMIMAMYDTTTPNLKYVAFVEEILPFTDFVPSATIGWAAQFGPQLLLKNGSSSGSSPAAAASTNGGGVPTQLTVPTTTTKSD